MSIDYRDLGYGEIGLTIPKPGEPKRATNADRIRAMTDEELADFLAKNRGGCRALTTASYVCNFIDDDLNTDCEKCWLDWLRGEG